MNQAAPTITTRTLEALGIMLEEHYGTFAEHGEAPGMAVNYATLWDSLITTLKNNTNDTNFHDLLDEQYIKLSGVTLT